MSTPGRGRTNCPLSRRCVNCSLSLAPNLRRRPIEDLDEQMLILLRSWVTPTPIVSDDILCIECFLLLEEWISSNTSPSEIEVSPPLGHISVCFGCGISIASRRTHRVSQDCPQRPFILRWTPAHHVKHLERVCRACWEAATRKIQSQTNQRAVESVASENIDMDISDAVIPPPQNQQLASSGNEIKVFCPKCNTEVPHTADGIQKDQKKILIAKVFHYFEHEYEELKKIYVDLDLTPLSKFRQRTALATGVSETTVFDILQEEKRRNAGKVQEPSEKQRRARKRSKQLNSSGEDSSLADDKSDDDGKPSFAEFRQFEPEIESIETLVVKLEPSEDNNEDFSEEPQNDPILTDVKTELPDDDDDITDNNETIALNESAGTKRKARKVPRRSDVTSTRQHTQGESSIAACPCRDPLTVDLDEQHTQGESSTAASSSDPLREELNESGLLGGTEDEDTMEAIRIEIEEE